MAPSVADNTIGALYVSVLVSAALYGAGCLQAWYYYRKFMHRDPWYLKSLVVIVMIFDTAQQSVLSACVYTYVVTNHGNDAILGVLLKTLIIEIIFSNMIAIAVQLFYCYRIYLLSRHILMSGGVTAVALASFISLWVYVVKGLSYSTFAQLTELKKLSMTCNILAAATDVLISIVLITMLSMSKTGFKRSGDMINRLIVFTFGTGLPTSFFAVMACVLINASPDTFWYIFFFLQLGRFYTNSFLVTLNTREYVVHGSSRNGTDDFSLSVPAGASSMPRFASAQSQKDTQIAIRIDTMKHEYEDSEGDIGRADPSKVNAV